MTQPCVERLIQPWVCDGFQVQRKNNNRGHVSSGGPSTFNLSSWTEGLLDNMQVRTLARLSDEHDRVEQDGEGSLILQLLCQLHMLHTLLGGREASGKSQITVAEGVFWEHGYLGFLMSLRILNPVCAAYRGHAVTPNLG
jgi:hypothetical protein